MGARDHARYGSSRAHRLFGCPGSIQAADKYPEPSRSEAADEGTRSHELLELSIHKGLGRIRGAENATPEMISAIEVVHDFLEMLALQRPGVRLEITIEQPFQFPQSVVPSEDAAGIGDLMIYDPVEHDAWAVEFKYGMVAVSERRNPQLMWNSCGLFWRKPIRRLTLVVIQPRVTWHPGGVVRQWETDGVDLVEFQAEAEAAIRASLAPDAPRIPGEWCRYCPAEVNCPARMRLALVTLGGTTPAVLEQPPAVEDMQPDRLAHILRNAERVREWLAAVEKYAHKLAMENKPIPGHKLVEAKAQRKWQHTAPVISRELSLLSGLPPEKFLRTMPLTITDAEALVVEGVKANTPLGERDAAVRAAKEKMAWLAPSKASASTILVPDTDPRPAANRLAVFADVKL